MKRVERIMYSKIGFQQYMRLLELERKAKAEEEKGVRIRINTTMLSAKEIRERIAALHKRIVEEEKKKYLKIYPDESFNWVIVAFDAQCLWDGYVSEMEEGSRLVVEVVEMTEEEVEALPEFQGW